MQRELMRGNGLAPGPHLTRYAPPERTLLRLLDDRASEYPDRPWLVFDGSRTLSFGGARRFAARVAGAVAASCRPGENVAIFLHNRVEYLPVVLGSMAGGAVAVPVNARARGRYLRSLLERADVAVLVTSAELLDEVGDLTAATGPRCVVCLDGTGRERVGGTPVITFDQWLATGARDRPWRMGSGHETAYLQFTSGTTGASKAAVYSHHFAYLYSASVADTLSLTPDDVLTTPLPLYHASGLQAVAGAALHAGCTGHLKSRFSASRYWDEVAEDGATFGQILGPMASILAKTVPAAPPHRMRRLYCVPPPPDPDGFERQFGVRMLWQGYGMTEVYPLPMSDDPVPAAPHDTIGHPVSWMDYGVVDAHDNLLGPGEVGEMVFRPRIPHAAVDGYYRDPAATATAFRNFLVHTGDLGVYDADGLLHFRGRMSDRMRRRGENVVAAELEDIALQHDQVLEAAAYPVPSQLGEDDIKLDVVLTEPVELPVLHSWLAENLPRFMVPRYLEVRLEFPRTPSHRVEKYRLKSEGVDRGSVYDAD